MFFIKLAIVVGGIVFLGVLFVRRLLLVLAGRKLQKKLQKEVKKEEKKKSPISDLQSPEKEEKKVDKRIKNLRTLLKKGEYHLARDEFDEAEGFFVNILAMDDTNLDANFNLGMMYLKQGNDSKAEFFFHKLVNFKKDPLYYSNLGRALYNQGRLLESAEAYENALALDDKRAARFASLAQVYRELNNDEKALDNFEKASRKAPRNIDYLWGLIEYYQKLGRDEDVARTAQRVLDLDPYNKDAKKLLRRQGN